MFIVVEIVFIKYKPNLSISLISIVVNILDK
jgi:hypothetical protein